MLKHGCEAFKVIGKGGKKTNPYWYSYMKNNNQNEADIVKGMVRRFSDDTLVQFTNQLVFFDNETKTKIASVKI